MLSGSGFWLLTCAGLDSNRRMTEPSIFHHSISAPVLEALTFQESDFQLSTPPLPSREPVLAGFVLVAPVVFSLRVQLRPS